MSKSQYIELRDGYVIKTDTPELWPEGRLLSATEGKRRKRDESREQLARYIRPGSTVYTVLRHVSRSGMQRRIDLYAIADNQPVYLSGYAAHVLGDNVHKSGGIVVNGCGMDMGFHLVNNLSYALFGIEEKAPLAHRWL